MPQEAPKLGSKLARWRAWVKENWQVLLFWFACAFAGWYLGAKGYGMALYFRLTGIDPEEWTPLMRLTAQKDPKVGTIVSLEGLTDWQGRPMKLPFHDKMTALLFFCAHCGMEEKLQVFQDFAQRHADKVRMVIVFIGQPDAEVLRLSQSWTGVVWARDPKLVVFQRLNALHMPRLYLIASDGTLRYLSPLVGYLWDADRWAKELERVSKRVGR
ncbi:peroxiredoxin family protein [Fervidibacter sacchari]